jgi:hypothetical protein
VAAGSVGCGYVGPMDRPSDRPDRTGLARHVELGPVAGAGTPGGARGGALDERLERFAAEARVDEAARTRSRERWLRRQAEEDSTVAGALVDLRDGAVPVAVHTRGGARHQGVIRAVGVDHLVVADTDGRGEVVVARAALAFVRTSPGEAAVLGDRSPRSAPRLVDVLADLADERTAVRVVTAGGDVVAGVVRAVGQDLVVVWGPDAPPTVAYVPVDAISEVVVDG